MSSNDKTGKCEKAIRDISAIGEQKGTINKYLKTAHDSLAAIIREPEICTGTEKKEGPWKPKRRINFTVYELEFHIDFLFAADGQDIQGMILYGVSRKACYQDPRFPGAKEEEKALLQFTVDHRGKVSAEDKLSDEWWLTVVKKNKNRDKDKKDNDKMVSDLHFRALDLIWRDALNWTNENLTP